MGVYRVVPLRILHGLQVQGSEPGSTLCLELRWPTRAARSTSYQTENLFFKFSFSAVAQKGIATIEMASQPDLRPLYTFAHCVLLQNLAFWALFSQTMQCRFHPCLVDRCRYRTTPYRLRLSGSSLTKSTNLIHMCHLNLTYEST